MRNGFFSIWSIHFKWISPCTPLRHRSKHPVSFRYSAYGKYKLRLLLRRHNAYTSAVKEDHLNTFSLLHFNIRSLPKHFDDFTDYLELLTHKFTIIGLTETWLKPHNIDLFELKHYNSFHRYTENQSGDGVTFYIQEDIEFTVRDDWGEFEEELEMVFIEID